MTQEHPAVLPTGVLVTEEPGGPNLTRRETAERVRHVRAMQLLAHTESQGLLSDRLRSEKFRHARDCAAEAERIEKYLKENFVPQHGPDQFLSPRAFFVSPLFRVCPERDARSPAVAVELMPSGSKASLRYEGPELRQLDGLVFLSLLHMARDVHVGKNVSFSAAEVCRALFGGYGGDQRKQLLEHINRLQKGLIHFGSTSVQLCQRFDHPRSGPWTVALDPLIIELFKISKETWIRLEPRLKLPSGLATWLFSFVEAQILLAPIRLSDLKAKCGSRSEDKAFSNRMRVALSNLVACNVIEPGWRIKRGELTWEKTPFTLDAGSVQHLART